MPSVFACPGCGKEYPREKRLNGRAVVCACGQRFLVPPESAQPPPRAAEGSAGGPRFKPSAPPAGRARAPAVPSRPPRQAAAPARWSGAVSPAPVAQPLEAEIVALPLEAEVVSAPLEAEIVSLPLAPLAAAVPSPYMPQVVLGPMQQEYAPVAAPAKKKSKKPKKKRHCESGDGGESVMGRWAGGVAGLILVIALRIGIRLGCREAREALRDDRPAAQQDIRGHR